MDAHALCLRRILGIFAPKTLGGDRQVKMHCFTKHFGTVSVGGDLELVQERLEDTPSRADH